MIAEWMSQLTEAETYFLMMFSFVAPAFFILMACIGKDHRRLKRIEQQLGISPPPSLLRRIQRVLRRLQPAPETPAPTPQTSERMPR